MTLTFGPGKARICIPLNSPSQWNQMYYDLSDETCIGTYWFFFLPQQLNLIVQETEDMPQTLGKFQGMLSVLESQSNGPPLEFG